MPGEKQFAWQSLTLSPQQAVRAWVGRGRQRQNLEESRAADMCFWFSEKACYSVQGKLFDESCSPCSGPEVFGKAEIADVSKRAKHIRYAAICTDITRNAPVIWGRF